MIAGFDISTSTIGICILDDNGDVVSMDFIKPQGSTIFEKMKDANQKFLDLFDFMGWKIDSFYCEEPNIRFQAGHSSAQVIATILRFNGSFVFTVINKLNKLPNECMAVSARKKVIGRGRFAKGANTKEEVFKWVSSKIKWNWPLIEKGKNTGKVIHEVYDMADAYIMAYYGFLNERNKQTKD